ncbi:MAG: hypothetical protein JHC87_08975 [Thermoleophilaceae bacterium]|nr:hypothetical protein [Thermoleophilaceae bacterium]
MENATRKPLLFVDVDGVISTWGFDHQGGAPGKFHNVEGIMHHIAPGTSERMHLLIPHFEMIWATGWGHRANEHLVYLLGLPQEFEVVDFQVVPSTDGSGHWKLDALDERALDFAVAWIDDGLNEACQAWANDRPHPTLLVPTEPSVGMTDEHVETLVAWTKEY